MHSSRFKNPQFYLNVWFAGHISILRHFFERGPQRVNFLGQREWHVHRLLQTLLHCLLSPVHQHQNSFSPHKHVLAQLWSCSFCLNFAEDGGRSLTWGQISSFLYLFNLFTKRWMVLIYSMCVCKEHYVFNPSNLTKLVKHDFVFSWYTGDAYCLHFDGLIAWQHYSCSIMFVQTLQSWSNVPFNLICCAFGQFQGSLMKEKRGFITHSFF